MLYRELGRTGLNVSRICLGTMTWGEQNTEADGFEQMDYAVSRGVNFFDTAEMYAIPPKAETQGRTETIIGNWFKARGNRDKIILASKVAGRGAMNWLRKDGSPVEQTPAQMREAIEGSLRRLQTDYIDLYQLHWPDRPMPWGSNPTTFKLETYQGQENSMLDILETLQRFVKEGKIRHVGLSNESAWGTMQYLALSEKHGLPRMASIQNAYNLLNRTYETALAEVSIREDIGLLAFSPLAQGYLTGKYLDGARPAGARTTLFNRGQRYQTPNAEPAIKAYVALAKEAGLRPEDLAQAFVNTRPFLGANIIGATTMVQLEIAISSVDIAMTAELEARINAIHHLYCNPCP
jgi:aryl-alcohol dehydrogenase-like predicted oxidoreductase